MRKSVKKYLYDNFKIEGIIEYDLYILTNKKGKKMAIPSDLLEGFDYQERYCEITGQPIGDIKHQPPVTVYTLKKLLVSLINH